MLWKTVGGIIQAAGRGIRSNKDYADTIIIDGSFGDVIRHSSKFLPKWFQDSISKYYIIKTLKLRDFFYYLIFNMFHITFVFLKLQLVNLLKFLV
jgi:hypothetical protein